MMPFPLWASLNPSTRFYEVVQVRLHSHHTSIQTLLLSSNAREASHSSPFHVQSSYSTPVVQSHSYIVSASLRTISELPLILSPWPAQLHSFLKRESLVTSSFLVSWSFPPRTLESFDCLLLRSFGWKPLGLSSSPLLRFSSALE